MNWLLVVTGVFISVHVLSEQVNSNQSYLVEGATTAANRIRTNSVVELLSTRSCDEGSKFLAWDKYSKRPLALFVTTIKA